MKKIFVIILFLGIFSSHALVAHADGTCYAPVPVNCATLSATECAQQDAVYQSEATIYNTCIANSYATDDQNTANEARIRSYCTGSNSAACIASYNACQADAPTNGFGSPDGSSCTYTCNTGYYLDVSGLCDPEGGSVTQTPAPVAAVTSTPAPAVVATPTPTAAPAVVTQTVVTQSVAPSSTPVAKPKSIFAEITQAVAPKPAPAATMVTVVATTSSTTTPVAEVQPVAQSTNKPASFWTKVSNFFAKLNPLNWF